MADYIFGLSISSLIALFLGINKKWRIASRNGLRNSLILIAALIASLIIYGEIDNDSSSAFWGLLGIATLPLYIFTRSMLQRQARCKGDAANVDKLVRKHSSVEHLPKPAPAKLKATDGYIDKPASVGPALKAVNGSKYTALARRPQIIKDEGFPDWHISISFGKSRSENFPQARGLAMMAPKYLEHTVEGKVIHQAVYSSKPSEYLAFVKIYELVSEWKSCFVIINGQMVDRKIVGGLNYCYGDRCRSGNPEFCYGASYMTENPFGCHRIQISACNNPWWTFGRFDSKGVWLVDKEAMLKRILEYSEPYRLCPVFSIERVMAGLEGLPNRINTNRNSKWLKAGNALIPR